MAGKIPSFITGATARVRAGGKTFAYAQDVSYRVTVDTIPIETMGRYEAVTNEPVNYSVAGELSVVRYTSIAGTNGMPGAAALGNGLGNVAMGSTPTPASNQIDPSQMILSQTWDLEVFQKATIGVNSTGTSSQLVVKISDCRFNNKTGGLNKRGVLVERLSFVGILAWDDSFIAAPSGDLDLT